MSETTPLKSRGRNDIRVERLEYFSKIGFPRNLNFNLDFGNSVIMVRTHFEGNRNETVSETIERIVLRSK